MRSLLWLTVFTTCLLAVSVDAVILRPYPRPPFNRDNALLERSQGGNGGGQDGRQGGSRRRDFKPRAERCCKIGKKTARKRFSCSVVVHALARRLNQMQQAKYKSHQPELQGRRYSKAFSVKIAKCSRTYPKYFEKCCAYKVEYIQKLAQCSELKRRERRQCRRRVRQRYP